MGEKGFHFLRVPDPVLAYLFGPGNQTPKEVRESFLEYLNGVADGLIIKPIPGEKFNLCMVSELKRDAEIAKLKKSQRAWLRGLNFQIHRTKEDFKSDLEEFENF